jgi:Fe-S cluster biosynthesis and repair protein YggX
VGTVEQLSVHDGVQSEVLGNRQRAATVPTDTVAIIGMHEAIMIATDVRRRKPDRIESMSERVVRCVKLGEDLPGLDAPPWPGEIGQRIYEQVSAKAWKQWEERQKMILNELRLLPWQKESQAIILKHLEDFFFSEGSALPPGYVPPAR